MAALRDIARDFAAEIRDGIGWTIVYRTGRSWNALTIWSDIWNGEWETDDLNDAIGILKADPDAVIVNGCTSQLTQRKPEPGRSTATASGAMFSRLWLRKEVEAHDSQVRRLRARLERQHLPEDPPHRLHLPAL